MTDRLYYHDSFLYDFDAEIRENLGSPRPGVILDRTAFYPTSGGQVHDTGWLTNSDGAKARVTEVADTEDGRVVHYLEAPLDLKPGTRVRGQIDPARRRDHMQQHSAQHVLSAAFVRLYNMPTVSFHMGDDYCSIDLDTPNLTKEQVEAAERLANEIILESRSVDIRFVTREEAATLGVRKIPPAVRAPGFAGVAKPGRGDQLRLIDIHDLDVTACGGTHVRQTGQIGCILLRKMEKVRQGWRVEFVAGQRAVAAARRDFTTLTDAASLFSAHIYDVPNLIRKSLDEIKVLRKQQEESLEELAEAQATALLASTPESGGRKLVVRTFEGREMSFLKLLAQKLTRLSPSVVALLGTKSPQPSLVFAQSPGQPFDMVALMKKSVAELGGRGGGSKDMAQGGVTSANKIEAALQELSRTITA